MELSSDPDIDDSLRMKLFQASIADHFQGLAKKYKLRHNNNKLPLTADALVARFQQYIKHGDDPRWYPISANRILNTSDNKDAREEQLDLFKFWNEEEQQGFIGVTIHDLTNTLKGVEELDDAQAKHVADLLNMSGTGLATDLCQQLYAENEAVYDRLESALSGTDMLAKIGHAIKEHNTMLNELRGSQKKKRKGKKKASDFKNKEL
jgi:hypothetical protein